MLNTWTCMEVGSVHWHIWQINRKGLVSAIDRVIVPSEDLWNPLSMSRGIKTINLDKKIIMLLNTPQTSVRISSDPDTNFTFWRETGEYIFSRNTIGKKTWVTAVPSKISNSLLEMFRLINVRPGRIHAIDTLEYRMACYFGKLHKSNFWLLIPQKPGIRLIILEEGLPCSCHFFSNDPVFRLKELTRILLSRTLPKLAFVLSCDQDYIWIEDFLQENSIELINSSEGLEYKRIMIEEWYKCL